MRQQTKSTCQNGPCDSPSNAAQPSLCTAKTGSLATSRSSNWNFGFYPDDISSLRSTSTLLSKRSDTSSSLRHDQQQSCLYSHLRPDGNGILKLPKKSLSIANPFLLYHLSIRVPGTFPTILRRFTATRHTPCAVCSWKNLITSTPPCSTAWQSLGSSVPLRASSRLV